LDWNRQLATALLALRDLPADAKAPDEKTIEAIATKHQLNPIYLAHCAKLVAKAQELPGAFFAPWSYAATLSPETLASKADELTRRVSASAITNGALTEFQGVTTHA